MQTLIDKNDALKAEIKTLKVHVEALKNKAMPPKVTPKSVKQKEKKSMFKTLRGMVKKDSASKELSPQQIKEINKIHVLLLKESYEEVELNHEQHKKLLYGKLKKGEQIPSVYRLKDEYGENVLMKAIKEGFIDLALEWIGKGQVDINGVDTDGYTSLMVASLFGESKVVEVLVAKANKDAKTINTHKTALHFAAEHTHTEVVQLLLDGGCDPLLEDSQGNKPHQLCKDAKTKNILISCIKKQGKGEELEDDDVEEKEDESDEQKERSYSQDEDMQPLLKAKDELEREKKRLTLMLEDLKRKKSPKVNVDKLRLKKKNNNPDDRVKKLHALVARGNDADAVEEVEELLTDKKNPMDIDGPDDLGETALMKAARLGFEKMLKMLLLYKCNTEMKDESGHTALMKAAHFGKKECVEKLIQEGAEINASARKGKLTALMLAAERGHSDVCELLIKEGADHSMLNSDGQEALELVKNEEAKEKIRKAMEANPVAKAPIQI